MLHRRLSAGMGLAALAAFAAGAGLDAYTLSAGAGLLLAALWQPPAHWGRRVEAASRVGIVALCAWMLYVAFVQVGDFMPQVLAMLLFLLVAESLRGVEARNDMRLYSLSFALLIAATAYYPGIGFAAAFAAYVALSALAMMVGFLRRQAEGYRAPDIRIGRRFLWTTAALSGVTLLMSAALFVIFPRLPRQWNVQGRTRGGEAMVGFSGEVSLGQHGSRLQLSPNPELAFRAEFPRGRPDGVERMHWRGRSFDRFDGVRWSRGPAGLVDLPPGAYVARWGGPLREVRIFGGPPGAPVLFGPHPVVEVRARSAVRVFRDRTGDLRFFGGETPVYTVLSAAPLPPADALADVDEPDPPQMAPYLALPRLSPDLYRLADSLRRPTGSRLEQVLEVQRHLSAFRYTLDLPATRAETSVEHFLFRRRAGHCEYFSTAMAVLLRAQGVPARNVTGFLGGEWNDAGYLRVTANEAHSWVEVWFPGAGWVPFDPTPPSRDEVVAEGTAPGWSFPFTRWFDGVEYRWYKWVIDYNLDRQLALFRGVGDLLGRRGPGGAGGASTGGGGAGGGGGVPDGVVWAVAALLAAGGGVWVLRRRAARLPSEARAYLKLRRAYARARVGDPAAGPLQWAEGLARQGAPGAAAARRAVAVYLDARFGRRPAGDAGRAEMARAIQEARAALRARKKVRKGPHPQPLSHRAS
jgi:transglutaminase-like putative cysteine protease